MFPQVGPPAPAQNAGRFVLKNWRVRSRLLLLVLLPTLAALILGGFSVVASARSALAYQRVEQFSRLGGGITNLVQALQVEREDTIRYITMGPAGGGRGSPAGTAAPQLAVLTQDRLATDRLAARVRSGAATIGTSYPAVAQQEARGAITAINGLPALRNAATRTQLPSLAVIQEYAATITQLLALEDEIATGSNDAVLGDNARVVELISATKEQVSQEQAILTSALTPDLVGANQFQPGQLAAINAAQAEQQADLAQFSLTATSSQRHLYESDLSSAQADRAQAQVQQAITLALDGGSSADNPAFTNAASGSVYLVSSLHSVEQGLMSSVIGQSGGLRGRAITAALLEGFAVILVLALALLFTVALGRSMTRPLHRLRTGALEVAGVRLPETVRLMSGGGSGEAPLDVVPIDVDSTDEIGEVARAFDQVHREAVRLAANEAALRGNINAMFVNLSRRSQTLVERQIRLIDDLEQGEQDSERLANLFQMDHLATRMRRNSENLLVLAGHELSRRWSEPVALVNVLRAAVSEIEHYERVIPDMQPGISVRGQAVNDVVHLLSELAENATTFSPAETLVHVSGYSLNSGGVLLDITDQGVGMGAEEMAHANWRLDNPPVVDVAVSRRMGLFVVARLAARHGIHVRLRPASKGGLTALVWLPDEVVTGDTPASVADLRPLGAVSPAAAIPWMETGLAVEGTGEPPSASRPARDVRTLRPAATHPVPSQPGPSQSGPGQWSGGPGTGQNGSGQTAARDAARSRPEDEAARPAPSANGTAPSPGIAVPGPALGGRDVVIPPAESTGPASRLPIFESVESDWFRRGGRPVSRTTAVPEPDEAAWSSPADAGWQAAEAARAPVFADTTEAGLPKRVPKANLVPGGAGSAAAPALPVPGRSASQTRQRLSSFQQGIRKARATAPGDEPDMGDEADRAS
ncbi:MAG TPA: nitrate- and nitrite sensing domain-containing protein [Streptosporangiaceae bacterium]|nr:nitrate- and nitrite sensing domain-containing protein [Streptosporangiaceae bacterium]